MVIIRIIVFIMFMMSGLSVIIVFLLVFSVLVIFVIKFVLVVVSVWLVNVENSKKILSESVFLKVLSLFFSELNM